MHATGAPLIDQQLINDINRDREILERTWNHRLVGVEGRVVQLGSENLARGCWEFFLKHKSILDQSVEGSTLSKIMDQISIGDSNLRDIMERVAKMGKSFSAGSTGCSEYIPVFNDVLNKLPEKKRSYDYVPMKMRRMKTSKTPQDKLNANLKTHWKSYNTPAGRESVYLKKCQQSILIYLDELDADFKKGVRHELKDRVKFSMKIHGELLFQHVSSNLKVVLGYAWAQTQIQKGQRDANLTMSRNGPRFIATSDTGESYDFSHEDLEGFCETVNAISRVWRRFDEESQQWSWIHTEDTSVKICGDTLQDIFDNCIDPWLKIANGLLAGDMASSLSASSIESLGYDESPLPAQVISPFIPLSINDENNVSNAAQVTPSPTVESALVGSGLFPSISTRPMDEDKCRFDLLLAAIESVEGQSSTSSLFETGLLF